MSSGLRNLKISVFAFRTPFLSPRFSRWQVPIFVITQVSVLQSAASLVISPKSLIPFPELQFHLHHADENCERQTKFIVKSCPVFQSMVFLVPEQMRSLLLYLSYQHFLFPTMLGSEATLNKNSAISFTA